MNHLLSRRDMLRTASAACSVYAASRNTDAYASEGIDILISGGTVYDGSGAPGRTADVGIKDDRIVAVGIGLDKRRAKRLIDATGRAVAPGFIDPHTHTDSQLIENPRAESAVHQGVTTHISGNCGSSPFVKSAATAGRDLLAFYSRLRAQGIAINYASLTGHGALRLYAMGTRDRAPSVAEMNVMKKALRSTLEAGGMGLSTGLWYAPGSFAKTAEIIELCRELVPFDGVYATHIRDEGDGVIESVAEAIEIAERAGSRLQISHLKTMYPRNHSKLPAVLASIDSAKKRGVRLLADRYPYIASSTSLDVFFPRWTQEGSTADFLTRIGDPRDEARLRAHFTDIERKIVSWDSIMICAVKTAKNKHLEGATVLKAAVSSGKPPFEFIRGLLTEEGNKVDIINFAMSEDNLRKILAHPLVVAASDGFTFAPYGRLSTGKPHPRSYGAFARILGKYVREEKALDLSDAIRKMTSMSAEQFGLDRRGLIREGYYADLVVFDPATVADRADWLDPHRYAAGIDFVMVNGNMVIEHGEHTGALPGRCLTRVRTI